MTHPTTSSLPFSRSGTRHIRADFAGGTLTSDAGALLLREADRQLGLIDAISDAIPDPRDPALVTHPQRTLVAQRVLAIAAGYEDLNDHQLLRDDPLWQTAADHPEVGGDATLASPATLCRLENRVGRAALRAIAEVFVDQFLAAHPAPPAEVVLDFDATDGPVHGHQECRFFHGYYDGYCFLPLYVFCGDHLLVAYLRPSDRDAAHHSRAILRWLVGRLRSAWPAVRVVVRGDSGFCRWRLMRWCDRHGAGYVLGLARNKVLERESAAWAGQAAAAYRADPTRPHRVFGEFPYAAGTWDRERRVVAKAEYLPGDKANPRYVVTNLEADAQALYEETYCARGEMENKIKEQQAQLFAGRTSCHACVANQFRVMLAAAAYVLVSHIRRAGLAGTVMEKAEVNTIRLRLLRVAALVKRTARRLVVRMTSSYPWPELFAGVARRLSGPRLGSAAGP